MLSGCSKDEILDHYNNIVQSAGAIELTGKSSLEGTKEKGIDDYTGTYTADYENFSDTEYLFGGTSIKREAGKELSIDCTLEVTEGTAKVFWISGSDEAVTLIEATGTYSDTITLPDGGNYIGIECSESHPCTKQHRIFPLYQTDGKQRLSGLWENPQRRI